MMHPKGRAIEIADELLSLPRAVAKLRELSGRQAPEWVTEMRAVAAWMDERLPTGPEGFTPGEWRQAPAWVRLQLLDTAITWTSGKATTCAHNPVAERPQPVAAALWRPGVVSCLPCSSFLLRAVGEADRTCDGCGRVVAGLDAGEPIYPCAVMFGPLILFWGACEGCRPAPPRAAPRAGIRERRR